MSYDILKPVLGAGDAADLLKVLVAPAPLKLWVQFPILHETRCGVHTCSPSPSEVRGGGLEVQGHFAYTVSLRPA